MIVTIILVIIFFVSRYSGYPSISAWIAAMLLLDCLREKEDRNLDTGGYGDYPRTNLIKPSKYKFLFNKEKLYPLGIPKELYYSRIIRFVGFCIFTFIGGIMLNINQRTSTVVFIIYIVCVGIMEMIFTTTANRRSFFAHFKKLNRYNFIYYIIGGNYPSSRKKGRCRIVSEHKKGKYTYVTIKMLNSEELKEDVLFSGYKKQGKEPIYNLYEICKVHYII